MTKKNKPDKQGVVYSTNPDFKFEQADNSSKTLLPNQQTLYISLERLKGGKIATVVENFQGSEGALETLGKELKTKCGTGGTVKDGIILVQGEQREKVMAYLNSQGYKTKRKGG